MRNRRILSRLGAAIFCAVCLCTAAFAGGDDVICVTPEPVTQPQSDFETQTAWQISTEEILAAISGMERDGDAPLTPEGNLTLVDDITSNELYTDLAQTQGKQFITVRTRTGDVFYLIIDRSREEQNVYFLNMVDNADLLALVQDTKSPQEEPAPVCVCTEHCEVGAINDRCPVCRINLAQCLGVTKEPPPVQSVPVPEAEPEKKSALPVVLLLLLLAAAGASVWYFLRFRKEHVSTRGASDLNEYDFGEEDWAESDTGSETEV